MGGTHLKICIMIKKFIKMDYVIKISIRMLWFHKIILDRKRTQNLDLNLSLERKVKRSSSKTIVKLKYQQILRIQELKTQVITVRRLKKIRSKKIL